METEELGMSAQEQMQWHTALASIALLTMPFFAFWATFRSSDDQVEAFRMTVVLTAMVLMLGVFFLKQSQLDTRLMRLLRESRKSYDNLQQLQGHLVQAEKLAAIGRFVAGAAHEINNPLTAIVGYSDLLANQDSLNKEHKNFAEKILQQARRTKSLVQNLLTFAKQTPLERRPINVNAVVGHALQLHELDFAGKNLEITCRLQDDLPPVIGDENQLLQVFLHIMNNAVDAMLEHSDGGKLVISTGVEDRWVIWSCSDTGPGVPDPTRIFDPFFTTKPIGKGTGLGLSASYGIVRDHGGQIACHNRPEGGATFKVSLPPVPAAVASAHAKAQAVGQ
jgi:two-component system NtrC family sensor kinase